MAHYPFTALAGPLLLLFYRTSGAKQKKHKLHSSHLPCHLGNNVKKAQETKTSDLSRSQFGSACADATTPCRLPSSRAIGQRPLGELLFERPWSFRPSPLHLPPLHSLPPITRFRWPSRCSVKKGTSVPLSRRPTRYTSRQSPAPAAACAAAPGAPPLPPLVRKPGSLDAPGLATPAASSAVMASLM